MHLHFTDMTIRSLKLGTHWDDHTPNFGMRVGQRTKVWIVQRGRERHKLTLGKYPDLRLADARLEAKRLLLQKSAPQEVVVYFTEARDLFTEDRYKHKSLRTKSEAKRHLNKHFRSLEKLGLPEITDRDVQKCLDKLSKTPSEQLHAYRFVRTFFKWCTRPPRRFIKHSPMEGYEPPSKDRKGTRTLTDQELRAVFQAAEGTTNGVVRLLILWGTRQGETVTTARAWLAEGVLTIPGAYTKNKRDHAVPILPMAQAVLDASPEGPHYFPSRWGDSHLSSGAWSKIKREIQAKSGTKNWQLRDLRRTFRSNMARLGVPRDLAEVLINHAPPVLDEIYDRYDRISEKRDALRRYEQWLQKLLQT